MDADADMVWYCRECHSLRVVDGGPEEGWDGCYCGACGSTDIGEEAMDEWLAQDARMRRAERVREGRW